MPEIEHLNLTHSQRQAVQQFCHNVKGQFRTDSITLFGSHARNEARADSDIDLLVVLNEPNILDTREMIYDIAFEVNLQYDVVISTLVVGSEAWHQGLLSISPIHETIAREGVRL